MGRLQTEVPDEFEQWLKKKAPASDSMSDAELLRYWLQYAKRQYELEERRADP